MDNQILEKVNNTQLLMIWKNILFFVFCKLTHSIQALKLVPFHLGQDLVHGRRKLDVHVWKHYSLSAQSVDLKKEKMSFVYIRIEHVSDIVSQHKICA